MEDPIPMPPAPTGMRSPMPRDLMINEVMSMNASRMTLRPPTMRDFVAVVFRHRTLMIVSFLAVFLGVVLGIWMLPKQYQASMKILVKRERADLMVTPASNAQPLVEQEVTLEDLNSEVELLKSRDLLEKVVVACSLHTRDDASFLNRLLGAWGPSYRKSSDPDMRVPVAVRALEKDLSVEPIAKSKMIEVRYKAREPQLAAKVLQTLSPLYLEKHLMVHRPPGALDFFQQQTDQYQKGLANAEKKLDSFSRNEGIVSVDIEKDITLRKLSEFEAQLRETRAAQGAAEQRIASLEAQATATPARVITQVKTSDNALLLQQLKSTLLSLDLKRTELLTKYEPGYRSVQEIDAQIAQAQEALRQAEKKTLRDETTDLDKTRQWLDEELARARAELVTQRGRAAEIAKSVEAYRASATQISRREIQHTDLVRSAKTAEENYLLYLRKQEEARISDALDRKRIVNVAIAEAATIPALPTGPDRLLTLVLGLALAFLVSLGLATTADYLDPSFRTTDDVERFLGVPVIASLPRS